MPGIGVINNPHSRKNRKNPEWLKALSYIVGTEGVSVATWNVDDIDAEIRRFKKQRIDILAINGGDGSNSLVLTKLIQGYGRQRLPKVALLRGGTINIAANSCGVRGSPAGLVINLVDKYRQGEPFETTWVDTLRVEGRYGFVFGNGFIHSFLEELYGAGKSPWMATKLVGKGIGSAMVRGPFAARMFAGIEARVVVDGKEIPHRKFAALGAGTVSQIGLGFKAFHRAYESPHTFHLLGVLCSPFRFAGSMPRIYRGKKVSDKKMFETVATDVRIESAGPIGYTLDGENYTGPARLTVRTGPRLEIIVK